MKLKRVISLLLAFATAFVFAVSCNKGDTSSSGSGSESESKSTSETPAPSTDAPKNVSVDNDGVVTWDAVDGATGYFVYIDGADVGIMTYDPTYDLRTVEGLNLNENHAVEVEAAVGGKMTAKSSPVTYVPYKEPFDVSKVKLAVAVDVTEIKSGATGKNAKATFTATLTGTEKGASKDVEWSIISGSEYAKESKAEGDKFFVTAKDGVEGDKDIVVAAKSVAYPEKTAQKSIAVVSKPNLTQEMIDKAASATKIGFEGYVQLDVYEIKTGKKGKLETTQTMTVRTAMDETKNVWYAQYMNGNTGINQSVYAKKDGSGNACEVGVSFMNDEQLYPMKNSDGSTLSWEESGFYNNFKGLSVSDFELDEKTWRYTYKSSVNGLDKVKKMVTSANPYEFDPLSLELIIDGGEIIGISAVAKDSFSVVEGYITVQTLRSVFNTGDDAVDVPTISKFKTIDEYRNSSDEGDKKIADELGILNEAIGNMQMLKSYDIEYTNTTLTYLGTPLVTTSGFDETVTEDYRYYKPCNVTTVNNEERRDYSGYGSYGYKKVYNSDGTERKDIYNSFYDMRDSKEEVKTDLTFVAARAFSDSFENTKASFAFAPEIFTGISYTDDDTHIFYASETMCQVATTFYKGLGNDVALYGIFATVVQNTNGQRITPFLVVEKADGKYYVSNAMFYYDMGAQTGIIEITYKNYDKATVDRNVEEKIKATKTREIPTSWHDVGITVPKTSTEAEKTVPVDEFTESYFKNKLFPIRGAELPFFGDKECFGDTYALGMETMLWFSDRITGARYQQTVLCFYYDVPLDIDYTITTSLEKARKFLIDSGFEYNSTSDVYKKGNLCIRPVDSSLDLFVYVWTEEILSAPKNVKITGNTLTWDKVENAEYYYVFIDGVEVQVKNNSYTFTYAYMDDKEHEVYVVASAKKYRSSDPSAKLTYIQKVNDDTK